MGESGVEWSVDLVIAGFPVDDALQYRHQLFLNNASPAADVFVHLMPFGVFFLDLKDA